jgi:hypothetical protein
MAFENKNVPGRTELRKKCDTAIEIGAEHEEVVSLIMQNVTDPAHLSILRKAAEVCSHVLVAERNPTDDPEQDRATSGQVEQPLGLLDRLARLNDDGASIPDSLTTASRSGVRKSRRRADTASEIQT